MENHFKLVDYTKQLLFNATTKNQEDIARKMLEALNDFEKTAYVN